MGEEGIPGSKRDKTFKVMLGCQARYGSWFFEAYLVQVTSLIGGPEPETQKCAKTIVYFRTIQFFPNFHAHRQR